MVLCLQPIHRFIYEKKKCSYVRNKQRPHFFLTTMTNTSLDTCYCLSVLFFCCFFCWLCRTGVFPYGCIDVSNITKMFKWRKENNRLVWHLYCNLLFRRVNIIFLGEHVRTICIKCCSFQKPTFLKFSSIFIPSKTLSHKFLDSMS
jgi:hypothetical protein